VKSCGRWPAIPTENPGDVDVLRNSSGETNASSAGGGYFKTVVHGHPVALLTLNSVLYNHDASPVEDAVVPDQCGQFAWLKAELEVLKSKKERVSSSVHLQFYICP
jgi:hypothetical protein